MGTNIQQLLLKSLQKTGKQHTIYTSIIYNSIIDCMLEKKNMDIRPFIISLQFKNNAIILKTQKPIVNIEILHREKEILENISQKFQKIGIPYKNLKLFVK